MTAATFLHDIINLPKNKIDIRDKALRSISHALTETCLYIKQYTNLGKRDSETETQLSRYWSAAAIPLRHIDRELSEICEYKNEIWIDPRNWDPAKTKGISIDLDTVREKYIATLI